MNESAEELFSEDLDDQRIPEKILDTKETHRMIRELVDELPPAQKLCILMYYYDELPVKDIAEALDTSENTVKSRLSYARKTIKAGVDRCPTCAISCKRNRRTATCRPSSRCGSGRRFWPRAAEP